MKYLCLLAVLLTLPVTATAQQRRGEDRRTGDRGSSERGAAERGSRDRDDRGRSKAGDKDADQRRSGRTSTGFNPTIPSWEQKKAPWWERQGPPSWERGQTPTSRSNDSRHDDDRYDRWRRNRGGGVIYVVPSYPYVQDEGSTLSVVTPPPPAPAISRVTPEPPPAPAIGFLTLDVEPRALLQIYVDDVFIGTPADIGSELRLSPGTRRIELRARGYKPLTFSAEIVENRSINYRGTLERDPAAPAEPEPAAPRPPAPSGPTTMYKIQGCYLGNIPPRAADLRPGCDIARMVTFRP